ncbi:MAG: MBL fold metallo-hydrolase, partial [Patescibacteria group bacterium]
LDVGQGDSIYIEAPNGNQIVLDGGPNKKVLQSLGEVMPFYDRSIDLLALSHSHLDHFAGFLDIIPRYSIGAFLSSVTVNDIPEYKTLKNLLGGSTSKYGQASGIKQIVARRGRVIDMGGGVYIDILIPNQDVTNAKIHDGMMVLQLHYGKTSVLLTGDMEQPFEDYLVAFDGEKLKSDVLKVGHHGSRTSSSEEFLGYVSPQYAVISVGEKNMYGHPNKEILDRFEKFDIQVFRTDQNGTVILRSDGETLTLKSI